MTIDGDQKEALDLIESLVRQTGQSVTEIARQAGVSPSTLTRLYPSPTVSYTLSARTLSKLRRLRPQALLHDRTDMVREQRAEFGAQPYDTIGLHQLAPAPLPDSGPLATLKLEVVSGSLAVPVETRTHIFPHAGSDRYLLSYMPDDSMRPRFRSGDYLLVDRLRPPAIGSDVVIVFNHLSSDNFDYICIAQLFDRNRSQLCLKQIGHGITDTISRKDVSKMYTILGSFDPSFL